MYQTRSVSIGELLSGNSRFRMPNFQRPYSWSEETAVQLLDDLQSALSEFNEGSRESWQRYFMGPMIFVPNGAQTPNDVVDGQQRLVTTTIILSIIRDRLPKGSERDHLNGSIWRPELPFIGAPPAPRVMLRELDQSRFERLILTSNATLYLPEAAESDSEQRILDVARRLVAELGSVQPAYLRDLASFLLNETSMVLIEAQHLDGAFRLFRSINGRGQPLSDLDIIRAELLGVAHSDRSALATTWDFAEDALGVEEFESYVRAVVAAVLPNAHGYDLAANVRQS